MAPYVIQMVELVDGGFAHAMLAHLGGRKLEVSSTSGVFTVSSGVSEVTASVSPAAVISSWALSFISVNSGPFRQINRNKSSPCLGQTHTTGGAEAVNCR